MIATLLQLPAWFVSPDDKPSYQLFQSALAGVGSTIQNPSQLANIECQTIDAPTLSELVIQTAAQWSKVINYNYVKWNNNYYMIQDVSYVSANNNVVQIKCQIDIYLSFLVSFFNETNSDTFPVFFLQKHLNRYKYGTNNQRNITPVEQFYLLNLHEQLVNVGSKKEKQVFTINDFEYQPSNQPLFANDNYFKIDGSIDSQGDVVPQAYPVILWQMTANSTFITQAGQNTGTNSSVYPFPYGLGAIGLNTTVLNYAAQSNPFQYYFLLSTQADLGSEYYADVYLFPIGLNYLLNQYANNQFGAGITNVTAFTGWSYSVNANQNLQEGYDSTQDPVLLLSPTNHLYAFANSIVGITPSIFLLLDQEPALLNYANFNVRIYGQDNHIDLGAFTLTTTTSSWLDGLTLYLASFCITISPPNMMLTNVPFELYQVMSTNSNCSTWNYNNYNDVIYSCQLKATAPSASTNWANYMAENKRSYDMSLNVSQLLAQNAQANIKVAQARYGGSIASYDNIGTDLLSIFTGSFGNKVASTYADSIGANTLAPNDAAIQQDKLNYLKTGIKADYTRTSNMRTSAISTINTLYDSTFCLTFEFPPVYEQIAVINYYALYGYKLQRWEPFNYWNNRTLCNYVKIANFTNAVIGNNPQAFNAYYRGAIDTLLNKGIRIWNNSAFINNLGYGPIPYHQVLVTANGTYNNTELNTNNNELNYLMNNG